MKESALHQFHLARNARIADRDGWAVPLRFGAVAEELAQVQASVGIADVSWRVEFPSSRGAFLLAGPESRAVLCKLTSLNVSDAALPNGSGAPVSVAHIHASVTRSDVGSLLAFTVICGRDYAESLWDAVLHAGESFGIVPFGLETLETLSQ